MRRGYADRNTLLGDSIFVANPLDRLLSKGYATGVRAAISAGTAQPSAPLAAMREKAETTHYSVVDGAGNAVAVTYTINGYFGAAVIAPGTGFFLNNEMDDFSVKPGTPNLYGLVQGETNAIAPGKRPLSSMAPTLVKKDGHVFLVLGSPGGSRIITTVLETILNIIDYGMDPQAAVDAPRFHYQGLPNKLFYEPSGLPPDTIAALRHGRRPRRAEALGCGGADRDRRWPDLGRQRFSPARRRGNRLLISAGPTASSAIPLRVRGNDRAVSRPMISPEPAPRRRADLRAARGRPLRLRDSGDRARQRPLRCDR